jgi:chromosome segregation ATPase
MKKQFNAVNRRAESEIQGLSAKLHMLTDKIEDLDDMLRDRHLRMTPLPESSPH